MPLVIVLHNRSYYVGNRAISTDHNFCPATYSQKWFSVQKYMSTNVNMLVLSTIMYNFPLLGENMA